MAGPVSLKEYVKIPDRSDSGRLAADGHQQQQEHNVPVTGKDLDPTKQNREPSIGYPVSDTFRSGSYKEHRPSVDKEIKAWQPASGSPSPANTTPSPAPNATGVSPGYSHLPQHELEQMYLPQQFASPYNNPATLSKPTQFGTPYSNPASATLQTFITSPAPTNASPTPAPTSTATPTYSQQTYLIQQMYVPQQFGSPYNNPVGAANPREFASPHNNPPGSTKPTQFGSPYNSPSSAKKESFASPQPGPLYVRQVPMTPGRESVAPYMTPGPSFTPGRHNMMRSDAGTPMQWTSDDQPVGCLSGCRPCFWRR